MDEPDEKGNQFRSFKKSFKQRNIHKQVSLQYFHQFYFHIHISCLSKIPNTILR